MATNIKTERKKRKLSQPQLAEIMGVTKQSICDWEKGRHFPNYEKLKQLAEIFNTTIDYLLEQADNQNHSTK